MSAPLILVYIHQGLGLELFFNTLYIYKHNFLGVVTACVGLNSSRGGCAVGLTNLTGTGICVCPVAARWLGGCPIGPGA